MEPIFALVDCNNFFVSCERLFKPELWDKPVIVLSNNDGCIISRSQEAKALGIPMGAPVFEWMPVIRKHGVHLFSPNFVLYGDMSNRVMCTLREFAPEQEIYSIDEAFLRLDHLSIDSFQDYGRKMHSTIHQWTGIPVSIGIATTKTLAKVANELGKQKPDYHGVLDITQPEDRQEALRQLEVGEIWGVGYRTAAALNRQGIYTAQEFAGVDRQWVRRHFGIVGLRTVLELNGISCIPLDHEVQPRKGIISSRSFGRAVESLLELKEAVALYTSRAAEKLRQQGSIAGEISVYITTNRHKDEPQYARTISLKLPMPTDYTPELIRYAHQGLTEIFRPGYRYKKAGISLAHIAPKDHQQLNLLVPLPNLAKRRKVMTSLDQLNQDWGSHIIRSAAVGIGQPWKMKQAYRSPRYTTNIADLPIVKAK